ncbi:Uncharacterised protein [Mycobacteroides abscessus subsp. massiliense]|nr:Uncharacterised protein [Mycobacteroides abscessus subsp. massiliense]
MRQQCRKPVLVEQQPDRAGGNPGPEQYQQQHPALQERGLPLRRYPHRFGGLVAKHGNRPGVRIRGHRLGPGTAGGSRYRSGAITTDVEGLGQWQRIGVDTAGGHQIVFVVLERRERGERGGIQAIPGLAVIDRHGQRIGEVALDNTRLVRVVDQLRRGAVGLRIRLLDCVFRVLVRHPESPVSPPKSRTNQERSPE